MKKYLLVLYFVFIVCAACFAQEQPQQCNCVPQEDIGISESVTIQASPDCDTEITVKRPMLYSVNKEDGTFMIIIGDEEALNRLRRQHEAEQRQFNNISVQMSRYLKSAPALSQILTPPKPLMPALDFEAETLAELECDNFKISGDGELQNLLQGSEIPQIRVGRVKKQLNSKTAIPLDNGDELIVIMGIMKGEGMRGGGRLISCGIGYNFDNFSVSVGYYQSVKLAGGSARAGRGGMGGGMLRGPQVRINISIKFKGCK